MVEWTQAFLSALHVEEPSFCAGTTGGIAAAFDVRTRYDGEANRTIAAIDRRLRVPAPRSEPIELTFAPEDDPRSAAIAVATVARLS